MSEYDALVKALANLAAELKEKRAAVQNDKDLSASGRQKVLGEIEDEYGKKLADLQSRYHARYAKDNSDYDEQINPRPPLTLKDRLLMKANKAPGAEAEYLTEDERAGAILQSHAEVVRAMERNSYINITSGLSGDDFLQAGQIAFDSGDMMRLEALRDIAASRGDRTGLHGISGHIEALREKNMTPRQKLARAHQTRLNKHREFFDYGVNSIKAGRDFEDLRGGSTDQQIQVEIDTIMRTISQDGNSE